MTGTTAQLIALTCHGNAALRGSTISPFFPGNSTCQFCERVNFVSVTRTFLGKQKESEVAATPQEWFSDLTNQHCRGLRLVHASRNDPNISDRMSAAFVGGGGTWSIEAVENEMSSIWMARWEVGDQNAPDKRIWRVTYGCVGKTDTTTTAARSLDTVRNDLRQALIEIRDFSVRNNCGGFTDCFDRALASLEKQGAAPAYHRDLAPEGVLSAEAAAVLNACQHAWVFGGMGSWNDMGFDGEEGKIYDRVSERLFQILNEAIPAAANESFRP